jgi:hypothetical protein
MRTWQSRALGTTIDACEQSSSALASSQVILITLQSDVSASPGFAMRGQNTGAASSQPSEREFVFLVRRHLFFGESSFLRRIFVQETPGPDLGRIGAADLTLGRVVSVDPHVLRGQIGSVKQNRTPAAPKLDANIANRLGQMLVSPRRIKWLRVALAKDNLVTN